MRVLHRDEWPRDEFARCLRIEHATRRGFCGARWREDGAINHGAAHAEPGCRERHEPDAASASALASGTCPTSAKGYIGRLDSTEIARHSPSLAMSSRAAALTSRFLQRKGGASRNGMAAEFTSRRSGKVELRDTERETSSSSSSSIAMVNPLLDSTLAKLSPP
ncbi:unnamed protein product [Lampetra fluviatilis]